MIKRIKISYPKITLFATIALVLSLFWSCDSESDPSEQENMDKTPYVTGIGVSLATRSSDDNGGEDDKSFDLDELIPYSLTFNENTILQISQQTRTINPFQNEDVTYDFAYIPGSEGASWDNEASYNFTPYKMDDPLEWNKIAEGGSLNGGFALYCMYFPIENKLREKEGEYGATNYYVMADQSTVENLKKSDILGAYHSTPTIFSRIRFRLFHLMTYVRIRLFVPVYDVEKNTGYREGALQYATLNNVTPDFAIDWSAIRSSDTQGPAVSPLAGDGEIKMYQHPLAEGKTEHEIVEIKYKDYLRDGYFDQGIDGDYDKVRVYDFSVIIPNQRGTVGEDGKESNFTSTDFLNFYLRTNSGAITRYYFNQAFSANTNESMLEMNEGIFQYLQLYVPRVGNQVVFVGAKVNPWNQMGTNMLLTPEEVE